MTEGGITSDGPTGAMSLLTSYCQSVVRSTELFVHVGSPRVSTGILSVVSRDGRVAMRTCMHV
jgi:hypothetical protein